MKIALILAKGTALSSSRRHLPPIASLRTAHADDACVARARRSSTPICTLIDEGIEDVDPQTAGRSRRHHRHHGHGAARLRAVRGRSARAVSPSCSAVLTSRSSLTTRSRTRTPIVVGYAEDTWPRAAAGLRRGDRHAAALRAGAGSLAGRTSVPAPRPAAGARDFLTNNVFEATRALHPQLRVLRRARRLGTQAVPEARAKTSSRTSASARRAQADLRRPEPHRRRAVRRAAVRSADSA